MGMLQKKMLIAAFAVTIRCPLQKANVIVNPEPARSCRSTHSLQPNAKLYLKLLLHLGKQNLVHHVAPSTVTNEPSFSRFSLDSNR